MIKIPPVPVRLSRRLPTAEAVSAVEQVREMAASLRMAGYSENVNGSPWDRELASTLETLATTVEEQAKRIAELEAAGHEPGNRDRRLAMPFDIDRSFPMHPLPKTSDGTQAAAVICRGKFREMAGYLAQAMPDSREKSLALTHLEDASTYAVKAIYADSVESDPNPSQSPGIS
jgi:hypothetical protein